MKARILIIDDEENIRTPLQLLFQERGYEAYTAPDGATALAMINGKKGKQLIPQIVLLDVQLPDIDGMKVLEELKTVAPNVAVIIITGFGSVPQSVEAMRKGAFDYVLKPFNIDEIMLRVEKGLEHYRLREQVDYMTEKAYGEWDVKYVQGSDRAMQKIYDSIDLIAKSPSSTVLIYGETGTGKEVIARRIHSLSDRRQKPFVEVNATALTAELLESELFGHEAGAFTGAVKAKKGLFEVADGGTLFLDEIGDMDLVMQAKILRALQERKIRRVGGTENIDVDIRLVTATNKNLEDAVSRGDFREDLYYRLNVVPVILPALRERPGDIEELAKHFVKGFNKELKRGVEQIEPAALDALKRYPWPGNVRELRNLIERTMLLECDGPLLKFSYLKFGGQPHRQVFIAPETAHEGKGSAAAGVLAKIGQSVPLEVIEREHIEGVLKSLRGNKNQAAQVLGIDRTTLYNKLKKYQIQEPG